MYPSDSVAGGDESLVRTLGGRIRQYSCSCCKQTTDQEPHQKNERRKKERRGLSQPNRTETDPATRGLLTVVGERKDPHQFARDLVETTLGEQANYSMQRPEECFVQQ